MINRAAKAIEAEIRRQLRQGDELDPLNIALVAATAMMEPSEEMLDASDYYGWRTSAVTHEGHMRVMWPGMMKAAIDGGPFVEPD